MNTLPNPIHGDWVDSMADWAVSHKTMPIPLLTEETVPMAPAEACTELGADTAPAVPFVFPLEPILTRHPLLGPVLVTCIVVVWMCVDAYLESTQ